MQCENPSNASFGGGCTWEMFGFRITAAATASISNNSQPKSQCWADNWESPGSRFWEQPGRSKPGGVNPAGWKFCFLAALRSTHEDSYPNSLCHKQGWRAGLHSGFPDTQWRHWGQGVITAAKAEIWEKMEEKHKILHEDFIFWVCISQLI